MVHPEKRSDGQHIPKHLGIEAGGWGAGGSTCEQRKRIISLEIEEQ
jgi:hypothetical protein